MNVLCSKCLAPTDKLRGAVCVDCDNAYKRQYRIRNREKLLAREAKYRKEGAERIKDNYLRHISSPENLIKVRKRVVEYTEKNWDIVLETKRRYKKLHPNHGVKRLSPWANRFFIEEIYELAKLRSKVTGIKWHVDHIIPLNSPLVCGMHTEENLQVIPAIENLKKKNFFWPDMP